MWNQKCGMTLIGQGDKPRDRWLSADYHTSLNRQCGKMQTRSAEKLSNGGRFRFLTMNPLCPIEVRTIAFNERYPDILWDHPKV